MLGLDQGLFGGGDLVVHPLALLAEGVAGDVVALFSVQADQSDLLGLELADQAGLGCPDLLDGLLADGGQGFNGGSTLLYIFGGQLHRLLAVVTLDGVLDEFGGNAGVHGAVAATAAADAEEVGIATAALAAAEAIGQAMTADAAVDAAPQAVAAGLVAFLGDVLLIE